MVVSHMPHNRGISIWQRTWCKSVECARIYPPLISVGVAPPPMHLLCWESFVFLLLITVKVRDSFTSSTCFLICLWCCHMTQVSVVAPLANPMVGMSHS